MICKGPSLLLYKWALMLTQGSRWKLNEMREDVIRRGIAPPDERTVRERCLGKGVEVPDLAALKDFLRFQACVMRGKIKERPINKSLNSFTEWFLLECALSLARALAP
jgi:hypothetical protein